MRNIIDNFREYEEKLNKSKKTIDIYIKEAELFIKNYNINSIEDLKVLEDTDFLTNIWLNDMIKQYSVATVNKKKASLSVFSAYLVLQDIIKENKIKQIENLKNDNHKIDVYTTDETESILNLLNERCNREYKRYIDKKVAIMYKAVFNMFFALALRNEEVCRIEINDIDWNTGMMYVRTKGNKGKISAKSKMNKETLSIIKEWLAIRETIEVKDENKNLLFISPLNKKGISTDSVRKYFKSIKEELGIESDLLIHSIRHTKISSLITKGADLKAVSMFAHHSSQGTTERFYCHTTDEMLDELSNL